MDKIEAIITMNDTILNADQGSGNYIASVTEKFFNGDISPSSHRINKRIASAMETAIRLGLKAEDFNL
jgi:hypothetical protein